jgi:hypothetical protein
MPIEFRCSGCSKLLRTPDESVGKQARCPHCGAVVDVPSTAPGGPGAGTSGPDPFSPQPTPVDSVFGTSNPFSDNPYVSPPSPAVGSFPPVGSSRGRGMVVHVPVVAVLMMVQGGLELLMGIGLVAMGGIIPVMMRMDEAQGGGDGPPPEMVGWIMLGVYGGLGLLTLVAAGLHIFAGLRNYRFRRRTLGIVALAGGMVTVFTCYCAPTSIALGVYGLITYLNYEVGQAFLMGEGGKNREEILAAFR